ncbi:apolipoprotein N-acyltransferase [Gemmata sp. G18]|uniref:Apolipoprotein N-acyltransferase n=1 Tax=Gemmata palustris TaxID=2822762 RepID=A0ABS5BY07_9BACT|nr:apolipoprotein N-acyltransferase [Gemmata palustris]MBP3958287.1 apolipoprotein N-acyltransferase [Gemmata palustris]
MKLRVFLPAIASGVLLWAAFFPLDLGMLGFVALVPWLTLVRAPVSNRWRYLAAYAGGVVFFALATKWVRVAHPMMFMSWIGLAVVMPVFWLAALAILRRLDRVGVPLALAVPVAWVALEYFRMHFPTGFPFMKQIGAYQMIGFGWYYLGYTQHSFLQLIQIADFGGVYAVSFVVGAVNGALAEWIRPASAPLSEAKGEPTSSPPSRQARAARVGGLVFALALVGTSIGYGYWRFDHPAFTSGPLVAAIQGNVSQGDKMGNKDLLIESYFSLHLKAVNWDQERKAYNGAPVPDLVVWPETCCSTDWCDVGPGARAEDAPDVFQRKRAFARKEFLGNPWGTSTLLGLNGLEWDGARVWKYNSAFLVKPQPKSEMWKPGDPTLFYTIPVDRYDKMHLVPFGEYVPLGEQLPFMKWFTPYEKGYECRPGEKWTRFPLTTRDGRSFTFGCLICYEDSDPYLARQYVATEPVDFLVNISNDGWFDGTEEHEQHLAICRFRAIEARRSVVRSVNMGISGLIDADGRVVKIPGETWGQSKKVEAVVTAVVPIDTRRPPYAALGDWVPAACWLIALVGVVAGWVKRKLV